LEKYDFGRGMKEEMFYGFWKKKKGRGVSFLNEFDN